MSCWICGGPLPNLSTERECRTCRARWSLPDKGAFMSDGRLYKLEAVAERYHPAGLAEACREIRRLRAALAQLRFLLPTE